MIRSEIMRGAVVVTALAAVAVFLSSTRAGGPERGLGEFESVTFTDITPDKLRFSGGGRGASWIDYDGDGLHDLYVTNWGFPNYLFRNLGGGEFEEVSSVVNTPPYDITGDGQLGSADLAALLGLWGTSDPAADLDNDGLVGSADLAILLGWWGVEGGVDYSIVAVAFGNMFSGRAAWADYNNNGRPDMYVAQSLGSVLLQHDEGGEFTNVTTPALSLGNRIGRGVAWADYNGDGHLDLYVSAYAASDNSSKLFRNNGNGTFTDVTTGALADTGVGRGVAWADYNNDGWPDFYLVNGSQGGQHIINTTNRLFRNNGDGTFTEVSEMAGVDDTNHGRGVCWGDFNNNGLFDMYVTNILWDGVGAENRLYMNNGDGTFTDVALEAGVQDALVSSRDCAWVDVNNNGLLDLHVVNITARNRLFLNNGDGTFTNVAPGTPLDDIGAGRSGAWADVNNNGRLDVFVTNASTDNLLLRNDTINDNHWLQVEVEGVVSNRSGIGARIIAVTGDRTQMREVHAGTGYMTQHMMPVHFGLGSHDTVDELIIRWPSGIVQTLTDVPADQRLYIVEPDEPPSE